MISCDALVVGGGPAGSTCAWQLVQAGMHVVVFDKARFPRDKVCAGWIPPQVVESLQLDIATYSEGRTCAPMDGFHVALFGQPGVDMTFDRPVSYGIRRCEFDDFLLKRSGAELRLGATVDRIQRINGRWRINDEIESRILVGAGGHFCPVARLLRTRDARRRDLVTAVEIEFRAETPAGIHKTSRPRLYFRDDLTGYGWWVPKEGYVNIGVGLLNSKEMSSEAARLVNLLREHDVVSGDIPARFHGHAYFLYDGGRSTIVDEGVVLIGDAAGLAYSQSGEGIRPAVESGLLAAEAILETRRGSSDECVNVYRAKLVRRLGTPRPALASYAFQCLGRNVQRSILRALMKSPRFVSRSVIENGFLHRRQTALAPGSPVPRQGGADHSGRDRPETRSTG